MTQFAEWQVAALKAKLDPSYVATRKQAGRELSYIEGWHAISEANRIFGFDGWHRETVELKETSRDLVTVPGYGGKPDYDQWRISYIAKVRITVGDIVREGTGYGSGMAKPEAIGDAIESAVKEAETDAMKRALMTFGNPFGLALYDKTQANVGHDAPAEPPAKSSAALKREGEWERVSSEIANAMNDVATFSQFEALKESYRKEAISKGWNKAFLGALADLFAGYEKDVSAKIEADNGTVSDIQKQFPGARVVNENFQHPIQAG